MNPSKLIWPTTGITVLGGKKMISTPLREMVEWKSSKAIIRIRDKPDSTKGAIAMAELTIQIPDEVAQRLKPFQNRLPELLWRLLDVANLPQVQPTVKAEATDIPAVYQEVLDFLIKRPTPEEIITFKVSPQSQIRLQALL